MSKAPMNPSPETPDAGGSPPSLRRRNAASVTLRQQRSAEPAEGDFQAAGAIDPATKSLADALKISYRLLLAAMVVLAALYIFSGFQSVKESERGIRLLFGKVQAKDLGSGFQFSAPAPFGELVKVQTGLRTEEINNHFFPKLSEPEEKMITDKDKGPQTLADGGADTLDPDNDGQLLTADGNIVHARWSISYQRTQAWLAEQNINPDFERKIVVSAACQGVVRAAAALTIDDILKKQSESVSGQQVGASKIELRAKEETQAVLNRIESGITINQMAMTLVIPPRKVMRQYEEVQANQSNKSTLIENARTRRKDTLTQAAGTSADLLLSLIDRYEERLTLGRKDDAAATLALIDKVMTNEASEIDGRPVTVRTSGAVAARISDARQYRTSVVNDAQGEAAFFEAKRQLFESNPLVMVHGDWSEAMRKLLNQDSVQVMWLPPGTARQVIQINRDPRIAAEQEERENLRQAEEAERARQLQRERDRFQQRTAPETRVREN
ncbi:MAG: SPFH domain-containing protein [Phycisphaerales bacterium]